MIYNILVQTFIDGFIESDYLNWTSVYNILQLIIKVINNLNFKFKFFFLLEFILSFF